MGVVYSKRIFSWASRLTGGEEAVVDRACEAGHFRDLVDRWAKTPVDDETSDMRPEIVAIAEEIVDRAERLLGQAIHGSRWAVVARALHEHDACAGGGWPFEYGKWIPEFVDAMARHLEHLP